MIIENNNKVQILTVYFIMKTMAEIPSFVTLSTNFDKFSFKFVF